MRHIIPISGKDSLCTAIVQMKANNALPYEFIFSPTGAELPEVFAWLKNIEDSLGIDIIRVGQNLEAIIEKKNYFLPSRRVRYCTSQTKIMPMERFIGEDEANLYIGFRADEQRAGYKSKSGNITPVYPLKRHGIGLSDVYEIICKEGLKPPTFFWKRMFNAVSDSLGFDPSEVLTEWEFDRFFAWRSRANCYFCFNQRQYEIVGLWEHYPELAEKALKMEVMGTSQKGYTWMSGKPFDWYRDNSELIFEKRKKVIVKTIQNAQQMNLFNQNESSFERLAFLGNCGFFCGK